MKNEFIPYEQALALKELGFNGACFSFYNNAEPTPYIKQDFNDELREIYRGDFEAPLYQQAFRFFREKHNLISSVAAIYKDETRTDFEFWYYILQEVEEEELFYETYEEAELECLKKLIKILKFKKPLLGEIYWTFNIAYLPVQVEILELDINNRMARINQGWISFDKLYESENKCPQR